MEPPQLEASIEISEDMQTSSNPLFDKWTLWAHLPHDTDWSLRSYRKIMILNSAEEVIALINSVPDTENGSFSKSNPKRR